MWDSGRVGIPRTRSRGSVGEIPPTLIIKERDGDDAAVQRAGTDVTGEVPEAWRLWVSAA
jgi:hypothetical protein